MAPLSKKRKTTHQSSIAELTFDPTARTEYLTGFSKRKKARIQHAKDQAIKREKEDKIKERAALREQKKQDIESHVAAVNAEVKKQSALIDGEERGTDTEEGEDGHFEGFSGEGEDGGAKPGADDVAEQLPSDEEYVDEDRYTTVTVEAMGDGSDAEGEEDAEDGGKAVEAVEVTTKTDTAQKKKRPWMKDGDEKKKKVKKQKFRYESKAERSLARKKQKSKNSKAAQARKAK